MQLRRHLDNPSQQQRAFAQNFYRRTRIGKKMGTPRLRFGRCRLRPLSEAVEVRLVRVLQVLAPGARVEGLQDDGAVVRAGRVALAVRPGRQAPAATDEMVVELVRAKLGVRTAD
jgi:hypothetical protein